MARAKTPQEIADKQIRRATAALGDYKAGVQAVEVSPTEEAAKKVEEYKAGVMRAAEDGSYVDGLRSVSRQEWIDRTVKKGGDNYANGVAQSREKIVDFQTQFTPHRTTVKDQVRAMPNSTFEERMARMDQNARGLHEFRYNKRNRRGR
jgi:hypothetical protein